jgi:hypothetical protein
MDPTVAMIDHLLRVSAMFALEAAVKGVVYAAIATPFFVVLVWVCLRADR